MSERSLEFVIPGDLHTVTGGYEYDRRIIAGLTALGWRVQIHALDASFPQPTAAALTQAQSVFARLPEQSVVLIDGLAGGAMPQILRAHAARLRLLALVHHPLATENGLAPETAGLLWRSERQGLHLMDHIIVTSRATHSAVAAFEIDPDRISIVEPGTDGAPRVPRVRGSLLRLLCVATMIPRKGHDLLFEALAPLASGRWHLTCAGSLERDMQFAAERAAQLRRLGLSAQVTLAGEVPPATLEQLYCDADLFVLPTRQEGYGMAVAEALVHGLPVISTRVGGIAELVGTDAGLLVATGDVRGLTAALERVLTDPALLQALTKGAATVATTLTDWPRACLKMSDVLDFVVRGAGRAPV